MIDICIPPWRKSRDSRRLNEFHTALLKSAQAAKGQKETPSWAQQTTTRTYSSTASLEQTNQLRERKEASHSPAKPAESKSTLRPWFTYFYLFCESKGLSSAHICAHLAKLALAFVGAGLSNKKPMACTSAASSKVQLSEHTGLYWEAQVQQQGTHRKQTPDVESRGWGVDTV